MKLKLSIALMTTIFSIPTISSATVSNDKLMQDFERLMQRTQLLEKEVNSLRSELKSIKQNKVTQKVPPQRSAAPRGQIAKAEQTTQLPTDAQAKPKEALPFVVGKPLVKQYVVPEEIQPGNRAEAVEAGERTLTYLAGTPVVSSPYIGERSSFDGGDLITNFSRINTDLRLLEQRQRLENAFRSAGYPVQDTPVVDLSGRVVGLAFSEKPYIGQHQNDITLAAAELDIMAEINPLVSSFIGILYDATPPVIGARRISNSNLFLDRGFLTVGNLNVAPVYFTMGQSFVPFGRYRSELISDTVTLQLGRTKARYVQLGVKQPGDSSVYGAIYIFKGDTGGFIDVGPSTTSPIWGINLGHDFSRGDISTDFGVGYISNIADSDGMQSTSGIGFGGFGVTRESELLRHKVPGADVHGKIRIKRFTLVSEFVAATQRFDRRDLRFNGCGAAPRGVNVEGSYDFKFLEKPSTITLGYGWTDQALALALPRHRMALVLKTSWWRDTIQALEFRRDINYPVGTTAGGRGFDGQFVPVDVANILGRNRNVVSFLFGVYF